MSDRGWATRENISAVSDSTIKVSITLILSEPVEHSQLVRQCLHSLFVFGIGCIVRVQLACSLESFWSFLDLAESEQGFKQSLVDPRETTVDSDAGFAVFKCSLVLSESDERGSSIWVDLLARLYVHCLSVKLDSSLIVLSLEGLVSLRLLLFSLWIYTCFYHLVLRCCCYVNSFALICLYTKM